MRFCPPKPLIALLLSWLLACPPLPAQSNAQNNAQPVDPRTMIKPDPKQAKKLVEYGQKQEASGAYEAALAAYEEAARYAPFDITIVSKAAELRSKMVRSYSESAERLALDGNLQAATEALAAALTLDPSNKIVLDRMEEMEAMRTQSKDFPVEERPQGLPKVVPDKVIRGFHLQTDTRSAYEQVAASYGIKASFDPELPSRSVRLRVDNVDFDTAMKVLTAETGTFWRALDAKLIFVAADTAEKRRQYEPEIEQTFVLSSSITAADMTELVRAVRDLTGIQKIQQNVNAHSVTVRDTVPRVQLAGEIVRDLEGARGELLLEIDVLEVDRNKAIQYGITPPASVTAYYPAGLVNALRTATSLTALLTLLTSIFGSAASGGGITGLGESIPPIVAFGGGKSTFLLSVPSAAASFSESLSLVRSGQQVLMRAQDGKPATFFLGERYPITLSLLSGSLGSTGFTPSVGGSAQTPLSTEQFTVGNGPVSIATADFRQIGDNDLAVLNEIDNTVTILLNQGLGATSQFAQAPNSPISLGTARTSPLAVPAQIATGSLNSNTDALPDLLVTDPVENTVKVLLQNAAANGTFTIQPTPITVGKQPSGIVIGEFNSNSNGNLGFVVTNFTDNTYSVFVGNGAGAFTQVPGSPFALPAGATGPIAITSADFNQDGIPDLAIVNQTSKNVTILKGNGNGTFTQFTNSTLTTGNTPVAIASGTLSGSTGPGLAVVNQKDNTMTVYLGNGNGTFVTSSQSPIATDTTPSGIVIEDFLEEGLGGIAVTNTGSNTVTVYADLGSGLFTNAIEPAAGTAPFAIVAGDFASSTFPDIAVTNDLSGSDGMVTLLISPTSLVSNPGITQQPYPGSEYEDIGLKIKATPSVHENKEVTLQMDFDIKALAGSSVNGIPVITNRTITQTVRLKEDETSIVSGLFDDEETKTLTGIPGLGRIPGIWPIFASRNNTTEDSELLILITPRRMRSPDHISRTIYAGRGELTGRTLGAGPLPPAPEPRPGQPENPPGRPEQAPPAQPPASRQPPPQENPQPQDNPPQQQPPNHP
jgi:type II secretory pathway component GspD/PulD (secretin)